MNFRMLIAVAALAAGTSGAQAAALWSDTFDTDATGVDLVPAGWTVTDGTVDILGAGSPWDYLPGNGHYIDLDGSTYQAGTLATSVNVGNASPTGLYTVSFSLAGSQFSTNPENVTVTVGGASQVFSPSMLQGFTTYTVQGQASGGVLDISFHDASADNIGALLDNVAVAAVPEPGNVALLLAGLGVLGFVARRRRT